MDVVAGRRPDVGLVPARASTMGGKENTLSLLPRTDSVVASAAKNTSAPNHGQPNGRLRILLSAFSCAPDVGSEPGLSWGLARALASQHDVWLLVDEHSRKSLEKALASEITSNTTKLICVKLPKICHIFYSATWRGYLYYCLWQIAAYLRGNRLHRQVHFDIVHHVSYANSWVPLWLAWLRVPFVWNRGVRCRVPWGALRYLSWRSKGVEILRNLSVLAGSVVTDWLTTRRAKAITTLDRTAVRPRGCPVLRSGCGGLAQQELTALLGLPVRTARGVRVATIGRLEGWKGQRFGLQAFAKLLKDYPECEYWLVGDGPERKGLEHLARKLHCADRVRFFGQVSRSQVLSLLSEIDLLLHPSLREAFGLAVLEGMAAGRPVVCVDRGALPELVGEAGIIVSASPWETLADRLCSALRVLTQDFDLRCHLGRIARRRAEAFAWDRQVHQLSALYRNLVETNATDCSGLLPPRQ